jgi:hypothetical protein
LPTTTTTTTGGQIALQSENWAEYYLKEVPIMQSKAANDVFSKKENYPPFFDRLKKYLNLFEGTLDQDSRFSQSEFKSFVQTLGANQDGDYTSKGIFWSLKNTSYYF